MTYEKAMNDGDEPTIELSMLANELVKKWKTIAALTVIGALLGVIFSAITYRPTYTSTISYVINAKNTNGTSTVTQGEFIVAEYLANTYAYVIQSENLNNRVKAETGIEEDSITKYVTSSLVEESNIMEVKVTTSDAQRSFAIARAISECLPELSKTAVSSGSLDILEDPALALEPDSNNDIKRMGVYGGLAGLALSCAVLAVMYFMRKTVTTPETLQKNMDITHLVSVCHAEINKKKKDKPEPILVTNRKTGFIFSETYKTLRTKVERASKKSGCKSILISSTIENEGKTTVAANLALTLAQNKNKVILVDCDLRKPSAAQLMGVSDKIKAQAKDVVSGRVNAASAAVTLEKYGIDVIGGVEPETNSAERLSGAGFKNMVLTLKELYDYVIIDTPPAHLFTDADIMTECVDASILVVRQNHADRDDVLDVANAFAQSKAKLLGFVFNDAEDGLFSKAKRSNYGYSYYE